MEDAGLIVGAVIAGWDGWRGNIYRLAVDAGHRRRGIGLQLVRAAEQYLHDCGVRRVTALVARPQPLKAFGKRASKTRLRVESRAATTAS